MAVIAAMFIFAVTVMSFFSSVVFPGHAMPMLVGDVILLAGAYCLYIIEEKEPIRLRCDKCGKILLSNTPWVCSACKQPNMNATEFPFVHKCGHGNCGAEPKAYRCHHCNQVVFLSKDCDATNYAYSIIPPAQIPVADKHAEKLKQLLEKKEKKLAERDVALVAEELAKIRKRIRSEKQEKKTAKQLLQEGVESDMELEEAAIELKAAYADKYKKNPAMLKRMKAALEFSLRNQKGD